MGQGPIVTFPVLPMHRTPSPRVRGEGGVRGRPRQSQSCGKAQNRGSAPSPSLASLARPLPARGRGEKAISFSRCGLHPSHRHATRISPLSAPTFAREYRRWLPVSSRSVLRATNVRTEEKQGSGTPRDAYPTTAPFGCGARRALRARLSASHHGSVPMGLFIPRLNLGQASWDVVTRAYPVSPAHSSDAPRAPVIVPAG